MDDFVSSLLFEISPQHGCCNNVASFFSYGFFAWVDIVLKTTFVFYKKSGKATFFWYRQVWSGWTGWPILGLTSYLLKKTLIRRPPFLHRVFLSWWTLYSKQHSGDTGKCSLCGKSSPSRGGHCIGEKNFPQNQEPRNKDVWGRGYAPLCENREISWTFWLEPFELEDKAMHTARTSNSSNLKKISVDQKLFLAPFTQAQSS